MCWIRSAIEILTKQCAFLSSMAHSMALNDLSDFRKLWGVGEQENCEVKSL